MKIKNILFAIISLFISTVAFSQIKIKGKVLSKADNTSLPGVTVFVEESKKGAITDMNGNFSIEVSKLGVPVKFSYIGFTTQTIPASENMTVSLMEGVALDEFVVTALGVTREKKALGYATQELKEEELTNIKYDNVVNSISGKVAGVQVKQSGNFGGSTNIILRGTTSLRQNNQALFVVDGVPIDNTNSNGSAQKQAGKGYDYGNAVSDLNPDDIESMNVLKGAAATVLYGERAANGVIMITTKKARMKKGSTKSSSIGVDFSSNFTFGVIDKSTFPKYQTGYGSGYGPYYSGGDKPGLEEYDFDGDGVDDYVVPFTEDASYGQAFDPNLMVFQWDALDPSSPNYNKKTPWKAAENGAIEFFETPISWVNSFSISGATNKGSIRLSYRNLNQSGLMPNSKLERNNISLNTTHKFSDKFSINASANYSKTDALGRNSTGYSGNILTMFRQWWQTNVDVNTLKTIFDKTDRNVTWNPNYSNGSGKKSEDGTYKPIYWNNPYWTRYKDYQNDVRNRIFGNVALSYKITDNLNAMLRFTLDSYDEIREERIAIGSTFTSGYYRKNRNRIETNTDIILSYNKNINKDVSLNVMGGMNLRKSKLNSTYASTNGGLVIPNIYALDNNKSGVLAVDGESELAVNGVYASANIGYKSYLFFDIAARNDWASTLPTENRSYFYPAVTTSFIFSEIVEIPTVSFGKVRLNYAQVGKGAPIYALQNTYSSSPAFTSPKNSANRTFNNKDLKPEITTSLEAGLEMSFLDRRVGFDFSYYVTNSKDQILAVPVSYATGYSSKYYNSGEIQNKGVEIAVNATPIKTENFEWNVNLNWSKNTNEVLSLQEGIENLQLASFQGGVSINAREGEKYGAIYGTDYVYKNGQKVVGSDGYYKRTKTNDNIIGNITPDWNGGLTNTFTYKKRIGLSFLIDIQQGGDIFSLDQYYGKATGLYEETDYTNDLGNPVRNSLANGGGVVLDGVKEDGTKNDKRVRGDNFRLQGYSRNPNSTFIYDASYVKLREVAVHYHFPKKMLEKVFITNATLSFVASNVWIIHKNTPHSDPESGLSSGNVQGFQSGVLPTTRNFGFTLKLSF